MHGDDLIAEGQKTVVELAIPECPSLHEARSASRGYPFTADGELCAYSKQTWIRLER